MLITSSIYYNRNILSLRSGGPIGYAYSPIINPDSLKIEGWYASLHGSKDQMILPISEVRDIIGKGIVVDDHMSITHVEDLVRLKKVIELRFEAIGKYVYTERKKKLGKVADYAVDNDSMFIQKLYLNQSFFKGLMSQQLIIDRLQIVQINNKGIIVKENTQRIRSTERAAATA